ncbi:hypothetical protein GCM10023321_50020 [Pseudonocardia eucalypti]|uniref:DUF7064 domain-containing protein n=1 Tax=Pseudonocardia eucalypti TaxID=648755 RepID=A0ABP9QK49_9PSEU|nr:hypothetical protein [Pseudonocardia eucalypti]
MTSTQPRHQFSARDDLLHDVSNSGPHARESLLWTAPLPSEQLLVFVYAWREAGRRWGRFLFVGGPDMTRPEFLSFEEDAAFSGDDLDDCTVGGLHVRQPEPLRVAELGFTGEELDLSLRFEGIHEPFSWHDNADGCPDWVADNRFEQSCLVSGQVSLHGRAIDVKASGGHRDHSWGARNWNMLQHWKWINATAEDGRSLHAMIMEVKGQQLINGYINSDGRLCPIVHARAEAELDDRLVHRAVSGRFEDSAGRTMNLECTYAAGWGMPIQHLVLNEIAMSATLDGVPAVAHVELGWPADYVERLCP